MSLSDSSQADLYNANAAPLREVAYCGIWTPIKGDDDHYEFRGGYPTKKGLRYRSLLPWWKRLFGMKEKRSVWGEPEYVETRRGMLSQSAYGWFSGFQHHEWKTDLHVYKETHLFNGSRRYWVRTGSGDFSIDGTLYEQTKQVVMI